MNLQQLEKVKEAYDMLAKGISNPILINKVYTFLNPDNHEGVPMRGKIMAINRYIMFNYEVVLKELQLEAKKQEQHKVDEISLTGNSPKGDYQEVNQTETQSPVTDTDDLLPSDFLTKNEKENLQSKVTGTKLVKEKVDKRTKEYKANLNNTK